MLYIEIIYIIGAVIAISACVPQIRQLQASKASDEFSLATWATWLGTQTISLLYVLSLGDILLIIVNSVWITFYFVMVSLIVRYRHLQGRLADVPAVNDIE